MASAIISETIRPAYIWTGEEWIQIGDGGGGGGSSSVIYSPEPPDTAGLEPGALWMDSDSEPETIEINSFKFIQTIPETQLIIADNDSDTLNIEAGSNINISASSSTNTLNIELNNELSGIDSISTPKFIEFDTEFTPDNGMPKGSLYWHEEHQTLHLSLDNEIELDIGQQEHYPAVINNSGVQINRGELVMVTGVQGDKLAIAKAVTDGSIPFDYVIGIAAHDIENTSDTATIIKFGYVGPVNTNSYEVGTILYPNPAVAGVLTDVKPNAPGYKIPIAIVTKQGTGGKILVRMSPPSKLGESDSNVQFENLIDGDLLVYNSASGLWINQELQKDILKVTSETRPIEPEEGLLIYETDTDQVLVWNGSEWAEISGGGSTVAFQEEQPDVTNLEPGTLWVDSDRPAVNGLMAQTFLRWIKTLSASASVFSGNDDNLNPLFYTPEFEQVYLNGTLLVRGDDYTATDGLIITLEEAASDGDVLEIHAFEPFSIVNHYTKAASDAKYMPSSAVFLENWAEDEEGNLLPSEDSTFSIGSEDYKVKDLYLSASSLYLEDPSNPGQTIALSVDSEGSLKVGDSKLITESNANDTLDTSFLLTNANASATYLSQSDASETYLQQANAQASFRNLIINGSMNIWQRGTSFQSQALFASAYTADRWQSYRGGGLTTQNASRQNSDLFGFRYFTRVQRNNGDTGTTYVGFWQTIETANSIQAKNKTITLSFYARAGSGMTNSKQLKGQVYSGTGIDQPWYSFTGSSLVIDTDFVLSTTGEIINGWKKFFATGNVPSNSTQLGVVFQYLPNANADSNDYFDITGIQLEVGAVATPFEFKPFAQELFECQRYFVRLIDPPGVGVGTNTTANGASRVYFSLPVEMRAAPTITSSGTFDFWNGSLIRTSTAFTISFSSRTAIEAEWNISATFPVGDTVRAYTTGNQSKIINASSEL
jgi:hypothetical protein